MTSSLTVAFTGTSAVLQASFLPEIILDKEYSCALLDLYIKNTSEADDLLNSSEIRIICDIISNSYINGNRSHVIHQFVRNAPIKKGRALVEIPTNLNYFPVKVKSLHSIHICLVDSKGEVINFNGVDIICRINIKRDHK